MKTEAELFVGYCPAFRNESGTSAQRWQRLSDLKFQVQIELSSLLKRFYISHFLEGSERSNEHKTTQDERWLKRRQYYQQKASAWYVVTYRADHLANDRQNKFLSFPWVAVRQLCDIKEMAVKSQKENLFPKWETFHL